MKNFKEIFAELQGRGQKKRMVAAWGVDTHTIAAAAKAVELGEVEGAMSSLSIVVAGLLTVVLASVFAMIYKI